MNLKCFLAAFDFDYTIVNDNSDTVACGLLKNIPESIEELRHSHGWTRYMDEIFKLLHENNIRESDIKNAIISIPPAPNMIQLLRSLKEMDCEVIIISDANTFFIDEWLKYNGVDDCVNKIFSNSAEFINGRLTLQGYHNQDWCRLSATNMCKGYILLDYIMEREKLGVLFRYVAYCGDGKNDFCPVLKLRPDDIVFPRSKFYLEKILKKSDKNKARVVPWDDANIILDTLKHLRLKSK